MFKSFIEIRNRFFLINIASVSLCLVVYYYKTFLLILIIFSNMIFSKNILNYFIFTSITELFFIYILLNFYFICQVIYFIIFYQCICFLSAGLFKHEYKSLKFVFIFSILLKIYSDHFFQKILIPIISQFFLSFRYLSIKTVNFHFEAKIYEYLIFYKDVYFSCFLSFQSVILLILFSDYISKNVTVLKIYRKFICVTLLILSTIITPPDLFSQLFLFTNLVIGLELTILIRIFTIISKKIS